MASRLLPRLVRRCNQPGSVRALWSRFLSDSSSGPAFQSDVKFSKELAFDDPTQVAPIPVYRVMDRQGVVEDPEQDPNLDKDTLCRMLEVMMQLEVMDRILYDAQRQGRISFYMTCHGEEAAMVGSAAALDPADPVFAQYREVGVLLWRGFPVEQCLHQCFGNQRDLGKGKQMPVHYGSSDLHYVTISSPLTTQMPQASGAAYALKMKNSPQCVITYFGEGAASEGDAHASLNFASTLQCPLVFFCRNNGYAISTPTSDQYAGDGIASRGYGYGMASIRVDGNDVLATYNVVKAAREMAMREQRPVLVEAMTYRVGHHSTSDDSSAYRNLKEKGKWAGDNPINRLQQYMANRGLMETINEKEMRQRCRQVVLNALKAAEKLPKPAMEEMFRDVYKEMPPRLTQQMEYMKSHVASHRAQYKADDFQWNHKPGRHQQVLGGPWRNLVIT